MKSHILALLEIDENSEQVVESLKGLDRSVTVCKKFSKAIELLEKKTCSLIISDVHLENGGNVFDFLRWAKSNATTKDTPFVLLSCKPTKMAKYVEDGVRTTARLLGADLFLTYEKFDLVNFRSHIEPLLAMRQQALGGATTTVTQKARGERNADQTKTNHKHTDHKETE